MMRRRLSAVTIVLAMAAPLGAQRGPDETAAVLAFELSRVRAQLAEVSQRLNERTEELAAAHRDVRAMSRELDGVKERLGQLAAGAFVATPFINAPPPSSDTVGVAKVAVLAPRLDIDSPSRHDVVFVKLHRLESGGARLVAERELTASESSLELPLDQNGGLYALSWSTAEGFTFPLVLRDGATGQVAATVQVKQLQREGRFVFVGYRLD
jgi:hypothetical protein